MADTELICIFAAEYKRKGISMATISIERNQMQLLNEMTHLIPQYDDVEVAGVLKSAIIQIKKCKKVNETKNATTPSLSPKIQSLIGIVPQFSQEELESDEKLSHILNH